MAQQRNTSKISKTASGATRLTTTSTFSEMQADPGASQSGGGSCSACSAARRGGSQISGSRQNTTSSSRRPEASGSVRSTSGGPYAGSGHQGARIRYAADSGSTSSIQRQGRQGSRIPQRANLKGAPCNVCGSKGGQPRDTEKNIRDRIKSKKLEKLYSRLIDDIMKETKQEFRIITHYAGINLKIKDKYPEEGFKVECYKHLGRTDNYQNFLYIRKRMVQRWLLHHHVLRELLNQCVQSLPQELFQIKIGKILDLSDIEYILKEKIQYSSIVLSDFRKKISAMVNKECQTVDKKQSKIVEACTGLFSVFVSKAIAETIQGIVKFSECVGIPPYLKLYVDFKENLVLKPTSQEVTELFWQSIDELILTADELRVLGKQRIKGCGIKSIVLCLTEEFVSKCKQDIACNIEELYKPIVNYLNQITKDFAEIYSDVNSEEFVQVLCDIEFEAGCQQIAYYKKYIHKVAYIPDNEYFQIGQLVLKNYRDKLKDSLQSITDSIFNNLSKQHLREVQDICDSFKLIKTKAYQKPSTTDELIEIGKFMTWVKNEQLQDLNQRVHASLAYLCKIITLGLLSKDHMNLNAEAITWLDEIGPTVDQHAVNYDQLKFEAEEKLQKVIEDINVDIQEVYPLLVVLDEMDDIKYARKYLSDITLHMTKIKEIQLKIEWINKEEVCLSFPKSTYAEFDNLKDYVYPFYHLLRLCQYVQRHVSVWLDGQFDVLDYEITNERVEHFCRDLGDLQKDYRKKLRQAQDENLPIRFKGTVDDPDILNWPAPLKLCITALKILEDFKPSLKVMQIMCNDSLRPRHWKAMSEIAGFNITPNAGTTLRKMMQIDLKDKLYEYEIISTGATKEQELLDHLNNLKTDWDNVKFVTSKYKEKILILDHLEDTRTIIDDHMIKVLKMRSSVFVKAHETEVTEFYDVLLNVETVLDNWGVIQQDYLKLLPIFSISDVNQLVPNEKNLFEKCSAIFNSYIQKILKNPIIIRLVSQTQMVKDLKNCLNKMEEVKHGVNTYLEVTRQHFPRLYFLSNSELVELISKNGDFTEKDFLIKLFPGIEKVKYNSNKEICGVMSPLGEELNIRNSFNPMSEDGLHKILKKLEEETKKTLQHLTAECCKVFKKTKIKDVVMKYPQQSVQLAAQVFWTDQVENALKLPHNIKLLLYKKRLEGYIDEKVNIIKSTSLKNLERTIFKNLLLTDLNNKYLLAYFLKTGLVIDDNHFDWQVQLRYYFQKNFLTVRVLDNSVSYGYEYYGNNSQAILTPSVEKCNKTLLNAYFSNFLGLVAGKSGTGKSKTVSSLAESLGLLHFEFLCTNSLEMETLLQLLKGAVSCGAWLILDSFDKLKQEIFSVFTQELLSVLETKKQSKTNVFLENMSFGLNPRCFVCTLTEVRSHISLPENLKVLFRIFTLPKPDLTILTEIFLTSQGMKDSKNCSRKLVKCLEYFQDTMSYQRQYKFELKVVMNVLGSFEHEKSMKSSDSDEKVLCDSIKKVLYTCLVEGDVKIFNRILENVFHEKYCMEESSSEVVKDIESVWESICAEYNLEINNEFKNKSFELYNALISKTNIMIVGDVFAAKTTCLKVCTRVFEKNHNISIKTHYINPKCVSYTDLYGNLKNTENSSWNDGILLKILRENQEDQKNKTNLIVFDGHIDQTWIENIRGVLENKKLFLESGEVLMFSDSNKFIYEAINLADCDPFMIAQSTIIYFPPSTLPNESLINSWLRSCTSDWFLEHKPHIEALLKWFVPPCLEYLKTLLVERSWPVDTNTLVTNTLTYFQIILDDATSKVNKKEEDPKNLPTWIHATFLQAGVIGFSSFLDNGLQQKFDEFFKILWRGQNGDCPYPEGIERLEVSVPHDAVLLEYCYLYKQRGTWKLWSDLLKNEKIVQSQYLSKVLVPTVDSLRCNFFLDLYIKYNKRLFILGSRSNGKSTIIRDCYERKLNEDEYEKCIITFDRMMNARSLQTLMLSKLNKRTQGYYSPSTKKKSIFFLEDLNMTINDKYGVCDVIELLRQHFDHNSWFDLKNFDKISIEDVNFIGSSSISSGNAVSKRFLRHFNLFGINKISGETISKIYSQSLLNVWKKSGFPSDIVVAVNQIISATLVIYNLIQNNLKPTLKRSHYIFDLESISKVTEGCSLLKKESFDANKKIYVKLWIHEMIRVYSDRFDAKDRDWFLEKLKETAEEHFAENLEEAFGNSEEPVSFSKLFFGTFQDRCVNTESRRYDELNFEQFVDTCNQTITEYNRSHRFKLDIIFFDYALEKLARIGRILSLPRENALFLGRTGYGRQSLTKLVSYMYKHEFCQPILTGDYNITSWLGDFKNIFKTCGGLNKKIVLFINEELILNDNFLEIIDYYLREGSVIDLFTLEEQHEILELARLSAQGGNRNLDITPHRVFMYFEKTCRENLHLILSLNFDNGLLRRRLRKYPALVTKCTVIRWKDWPSEALKSVALSWINDVNLTDNIKAQAINSAIYFHRTAQEVHELLGFTTPKAYVHMIQLFSSLIATKQLKLKTKKDRYIQGLEKLSYAANQILLMQKSLAEYQPQLELMTKNAKGMTEEIALETIEVEKASALVRKDEKIASEQAIIAQVLKSECESELAQAIPILEDAISALNTLKPSDITLVKSMKNPPDAIKLVMASVCVIKDVKPDRIPDASTGRKHIDYWGPSKRILGDMNFLQTLKDFDKDHIKPEIMVKIRKDYLPHKDFKPHVVAKASSAAEGLCKWIIAMDMYDKVAKEVAPKKEKLNKAEKEYAETMIVLNEKKEEVVRIEEKLAALNKLLKEATKKQTKLQAEVNVCSKKLGSAQKLIGGLSEENLRWSKATQDLQKHYDVLAGDIMLSSAVVAYLASLNNSLRPKIISKWRQYIEENQVPSSKTFNFSLVLSNNVEIESWKEYGLPLDDFFVENAIIYNHSKKFCVFLDPQAQACNWIQRTESGNNLTVSKFSFGNWMDHIKTCVKYGKPILIKDTNGYIPPCLNYLLYGETFIQNNDLYTILDKQDTKIDKNFRLYIVCTKPNPSYSLDFKSRLTIINFQLTRKSLEEGLLKVVVEIERPEIKKLSKELVWKNRENKAELKDIEVKILDTLCESQADILEDEASISVLDNFKDLAKNIRVKQEETKKIDEIIQDFKKGYRVVAEYVTNLYFCVNDLQKINLVYQFSLDWFNNLFFSSILNAEQSKVLEVRCQKLCSTMTFDLYKSVIKGLFEKDKLLFTFWLACKVAMSRGKISNEELNIFFDTNTSEGASSDDKPSWVEENTWINIKKIENLPVFVGLIKSFKENEQWKTFISSSSTDLPYPWNNTSEIAKLILIKVLKPHQTHQGILNFIQTTLGSEYLKPIFFDMQEIYNETYNLSPVLFVLTPSLNVLKIVHTFATTKQVLHKFKHLSLGQRNLQKAVNLLKDGQKQGYWILFQNCHLVRDWLDELEELLEGFDFENTHENFRLFLSCKPEYQIPLDLIQNSIKVVEEAPNSLKKNLLKTYKKAPVNSKEFFYGCPGKQDIFSKLLYSFCHFHFLLQERYNILNWHVPYHFSESDILMSLEELRNLVNSEECLFEKVYYLIGECNYCGYLENYWEIRFINEVLIDCFNERVLQKGKFFFNDVKEYGIPIKNDRADYLKQISKLPSQDDPEVLYLTQYEFLRYKEVDIQNFNNLGGRLVQDVAKVNDGYEIKILETVDDIISSLPTRIEEYDADEYILREITLYNLLLSAILDSLNNLRLCLNGEEELTEDLEVLVKEINKNKIPKMWLKYSYPTLSNLSQFLQDFRSKVAFFKSLNATNFKRFWFGAFFFPRTLLVSTMIEFSRKNNIAMDRVTLEYDIIKDTEQIEVGCGKIIEKMFILGARIDSKTNKLSNLLPQTYFDMLPPIFLNPTILSTTKDSEEDVNKEELFKCCVFKTEPFRNETETHFKPGCKNYITEIPINSESNAKRFVRKGVCIVCEIVAD